MWFNICNKYTLYESTNTVAQITLGDKYLVPKNMAWFFKGCKRKLKNFIFYGVIKQYLGERGAD